MFISCQAVRLSGHNAGGWRRPPLPRARVPVKPVLSDDHQIHSFLKKLFLDKILRNKYKIGTKKLQVKR